MYIFFFHLLLFLISFVLFNPHFHFIHSFIHFFSYSLFHFFILFFISSLSSFHSFLPFFLSSFLPSSLSSLLPSLRPQHIRGLVSHGLNVFIPSYRGYGGSTGAPSEHGLHTDAQVGRGMLWNEKRREGVENAVE